MKRILSFVAASALVLSVNTATIFAADATSTEKGTNSIQETNVVSTTNEDSQLFSDYIKNAFNDSNRLQVIDATGNDVTQSFIDFASNPYSTGDYLQIKKYIQEQNLSVSYAEYHQVKESRELHTLAAMGDSVSQSFYHLASDVSNKFTKEWVTTLSGSFSYGGTYQITSINGPTISFNANFGAGFAAYLNNVNTNSYYSGYKATFTASYQMKASLSIPIGSVNGIVTYDFGSYTDTFNAYPSAMQN